MIQAPGGLIKELGTLRYFSKLGYGLILKYMTWQNRLERDIITPSIKYQ
jgi:hypothetical protein